MRPRFLTNPRLKKWSLFSGLLLAVGFSLSWNPELAQIARNEIHTLDLAQSAPPAKDGKVNPADPNLFGSVLNLGEYVQDERLNKYGVVLTLDTTGSRISYLIKKKKENTEGYTTEGCEECLRKSVSTPEQFQATNINHIKSVIADIAMTNQKSLLEAAKKISETTATTAKRDDPKREEKSEASRVNEKFAEKCRSKSDEELMDCQYEELKIVLESCKKNDRACEKTSRAMFKPIEELFKNCSSATNARRSQFKTEEDVDCKYAQDLAETILSELPSEYALKKAANYLRATVNDSSAQLRDRLVKNHTDPNMAGDYIKNQFDRMAGTSSVLVPQYDNTGKFVKMEEAVNQQPSRNSYGLKVQSLLQSNEKFKSNEAATEFFHQNFYDSLMLTRTALFKNPMGFTYPTSDIDIGTSSSGIVPPDLSKYRANSYRGTQTLPPMPQIAPAPSFTGVGALPTATAPTAQPQGGGYQPSTTTVLSPAQRGQIQRSGAIQ